MSEERFNPREHLRTFYRNQKDQDGRSQRVEIKYLDVKWRIVWFREEHPHGSITTELLTAPGADPAVVKATVTIENGVSCTSMGQCAKEKWADALEKSETRSIGRALALLGYGTQFTEDFDEGSALADSPQESSGKRSGNAPASITKAQRGMILAKSEACGLSEAQLGKLLQRYDASLDTLTKDQASRVIDSLQELEKERAAKAEAVGADAETGELADDSQRDEFGATYDKLRVNLNNAASLEQLRAARNAMTTAGLGRDDELRALFAQRERELKKAVG